MEFDHYTYESNGNVDIYRRMPNGQLTAAGLPALRWMYWVSVRPAPGRGKGLFAGRNFARGETIGRYIGHIIGRADDQDVVDYIERLSSTVGGDAIMNVNGVYVDARRDIQTNEVQMQLINRMRPLMSQPEWTWPGAHVHMANDPRGSPNRANAKVTRAGYFEAIRPIAQGDEILWTYGDEAYWKDANLLGTKNKPYLILNDEMPRSTRAT